jgi:hypothetical protein
MVILLAESPEKSRLCLPDWGSSALEILSAPLSEPLGVNHQDDQTSECQGKAEMTPMLLAELKNKARQHGLSLFAYLAHFVCQSKDDIPPRRSRSRFE